MSSLLHGAVHAFRNAVEDDRPVQGTAKAAAAGAGCLVGGAMLVGATAPVSVPILAVGAGLGMIARAVTRKEEKR